MIVRFLRVWTTWRVFGSMVESGTVKSVEPP